MSALKRKSIIIFGRPRAEAYCQMPRAVLGFSLDRRLGHELERSHDVLPLPRLCGKLRAYPKNAAYNTTFFSLMCISNQVNEIDDLILN